MKTNNLFHSNQMCWNDFKRCLGQKINVQHIKKKHAECFQLWMCVSQKPSIGVCVAWMKRPNSAAPQVMLICFSGHCQETKNGARHKKIGLSGGRSVLQLKIWNYSHVCSSWRVSLCNCSNFLITSPPPLKTSPVCRTIWNHLPHKTEINILKLLHFSIVSCHKHTAMNLNQTHHSCFLSCHHLAEGTGEFESYAP